jgi:hypothetical protein
MLFYISIKPCWRREDGGQLPASVTEPRVSIKSVQWRRGINFMFILLLGDLLAFQASAFLPLEAIGFWRICVLAYKNERFFFFSTRRRHNLRYR